MLPSLPIRKIILFISLMGFVPCSFLRAESDFRVINYAFDKSIEIKGERYPVTWAESGHSIKDKNSLSERRLGDLELERAYEQLVQHYVENGVVKETDEAAKKSILKSAHSKNSYTIIVWDSVEKPMENRTLIGLFRIYFPNDVGTLPVTNSLRLSEGGKKEITAKAHLYKNRNAIEAGNLMSKIPELTLEMMYIMAKELKVRHGPDLIILAETIRKDVENISAKTPEVELEKYDKSRQELLYERVFQFQPLKLFVDKSFDGRISSILYHKLDIFLENLEWLTAKSHGVELNGSRLTRKEALGMLKDFTQKLEKEHKPSESKKAKLRRRKASAPLCRKVMRTPKSGFQFFLNK